MFNEFLQAKLVNADYIVGHKNLFILYFGVSDWNQEKIIHGHDKIVKFLHDTGIFTPEGIKESISGSFYMRKFKKDYKECITDIDNDYFIFNMEE